MSSRRLACRTTSSQIVGFRTVGGIVVSVCKFCGCEMLTGSVSNLVNGVIQVELNLYPLNF